MTILQMIQERVTWHQDFGKPKIAFGLIKYDKKDDEHILKGVRRAREFADIVIIGPKVEGFDCVVTDNPVQAMVKLVQEGKVDALIRGTLPSSITEEAFCKAYGIPKEKITAPSILKDPQGHAFIFGSCTNYDITEEKKRLLLDGCLAWLQEEYGITKPRVGLLSGCRPPSLGKDPYLDKTYHEAERLVHDLQQQGINAKNYYIEIEFALRDKCDIIIAPDGRIGNAVFRVFSLLGWDGFVACRRLGFPFIYGETSRNTLDFFSAFQEAAACVNYRKAGNPTKTKSL